MVRVPYAIQGFKDIRENNYLYVDKTKYIEILENMDRYVLFLRPRRFGKTLFTSVLDYYYNVRYEDEFDKLFSGLYIGENKTPTANSYNVLYFNFSGIDTRDDIELAFYRNVRNAINLLILTMKLNIEPDTETRKANEYLESFLFLYKSTQTRKLFIIIDEYDHFANDVLSDNKEHFNSITGKDGFVRKFYEVFKFYSRDIIERIFITGVTPITMDSLTSGFNISKNLGNIKELNEMIGFTEEEVIRLLCNCGIDEKYIEILKEHYNGYLFNKKAKNKVYNSNLLMYFLSEYVRSYELPENLIDSNVISDYKRITMLFDLYEDNEDKIKMIEDIVSGNELTGTVQDRIGPLIKSTFDAGGEEQWGFSRDDFISLLYYLGLLTIAGPAEGDEDVNLSAPNYCISGVYAEYYLGYLYRLMNSEYIMHHEIRTALRGIINNNDFSGYKDIVEKLLKGVAGQDFIAFDEKYVKLMMYSVAKFTRSYLVKTEYELTPLGEALKGMRADLVFLPNNVVTAGNYYVFEIKYIKKKDYTEQRLEKERIEAIGQVTAYVLSEELKNIPNLRKYVVVAVKDELKVFEEIV